MKKRPRSTTLCYELPLYSGSIHIRRLIAVEASLRSTPKLAHCTVFPQPIRRAH